MHDLHMDKGVRVRYVVLEFIKLRKSNTKKYLIKISTEKENNRIPVAFEILIISTTILICRIRLVKIT